MPVNSVPAMGWTRRSAAISVLLVCEEQRKRAGVRVVQLREAKNWSQETLAQKAGLSTKTVSRFENGVHEGRTGTVQKLAKALGVNQYDVTGPPPAPLGLTGEPPAPDDISARLDAIEATLRRIEDAISGEALLAAVQVASQALRADLQATEEVPEQQAK